MFLLLLTRVPANNRMEPTLPKSGNAARAERWALVPESGYVGSHGCQSQSRAEANN